MGIFDKLFGKKQQQESLQQGMQKTREGFFSKITKAIAGKSTVDEEVLDDLENALVSADVGVETTVKIIDQIEKRVARDKYLNTSELNVILKEEIQQILVAAPQDSSYENYELPAGHKPHIILVVGVNGVGKTTTIGKLAHNFSKAGKSVLLGAADTFRAAAVDQRRVAEFERVQSLDARGQATVDELRLTQSIATERRIEFQLAEFRRKLAGHDHALQQAVLTQFSITAPFDGYLAERLKDVGDSVELPEPVLVLVRLDPLYVDFDCPLSLAKQIRSDEEITIRASDPRTPQRTGRVMHILRVADAASQTTKVRVCVSNADGSWIAGMKVWADFATPATRSE